MGSQTHFKKVLFRTFFCIFFISYNCYSEEFDRYINIIPENKKNDINMPIIENKKYSFKPILKNNDSYIKKTFQKIFISNKYISDLKSINLKNLQIKQINKYDYSFQGNFYNFSIKENTIYFFSKKNLTKKNINLNNLSIKDIHIDKNIIKINLNDVKENFHISFDNEELIITKLYQDVLI